MRFKASGVPGAVRFRRHAQRTRKLGLRQVQFRAPSGWGRTRHHSFALPRFPKEKYFTELMGDRSQERWKIGPNSRARDGMREIWPELARPAGLDLPYQIAGTCSNCWCYGCWRIRFSATRRSSARSSGRCGAAFPPSCHLATRVIDQHAGRKFYLHRGTGPRPPRAANTW
jgi:hypothetical protein